jgi:hypothetical protein
MSKLNVIIQAGGQGSRMGRLTANKPKALVPLQGKPVLFHALDLFADADVVIIGDYKLGVLQSYLAAFGHHDHCHVVAANGVGTCAGLSEAAKHLDPDAPTLLTWCDLIYSSSPVPLFRGLDTPAIGLSTSFRCRWSFRDGQIVHVPSASEGIAGCYWFPETSALFSVPSSGEFCAYLASLQDLNAVGVPLGDLCDEVGTQEAYEQLSATQFACRPFNRISPLPDGTLIKEPTDSQGEQLAVLEQAWYRQASLAELRCVPKVYGYDPLRMERVAGLEPYRLTRSTRALETIIGGFRELHGAFPPVPADTTSLDVAYLGKTSARLEKVRGLVPFADRREFVVNGRTHPNPLFRWDELTNLVRRNYPEEFCFIHGDPTFSNMLVSDDRVVFIDPRGYFGTTRLFGDPAYDWAKLLYSILTNYDQFNLGHFDLSIAPDAVDLTIESSGWEKAATDVIRASRLPEAHLMTILGVIWLSLTTYAWDDYDKVCGAFYKGTEVLSPLWD